MICLYKKRLSAIVLLLTLIILTGIFYSVSAVKLSNGLKLKSSNILNDLIDTVRVSEDNEINYNRVMGVLLQELADGGDISVFIETDEDDVLLRVQKSKVNIFSELESDNTIVPYYKGGYIVTSIKSIKNSLTEKSKPTHMVTAILEVTF